MMHLNRQFAQFARFALPTLSFVLGASLAVVGCSSDDSSTNTNTNSGTDTADAGPDTGTSTVTDIRSRLANFTPLPAPPVESTTLLSDDLINLGRQLYFDQRLSLYNDVSCNSCHMLDEAHYGVDFPDEPVSGGTVGPDGVVPHGTRNAPTVYNAALHLYQFWDGRAQAVEDQALGPILNPVEMGMPDANAVISKIGPIYQQAFNDAKAAFPIPDGQDPATYDPMTYTNVGVAIGAYERTLLTPARWDDYLNGNDNALTSDELVGLGKFLDNGCGGCHNGVAVGGRAFAKLGAASSASVSPDLLMDPGREGVTNDPFDMYVYKIPSLRNIEKTGPYFHDGSVGTLEEAVSLMAQYQVGKTLSDADVASIVTFLKTLTGTLPANITAPEPLPDPSDPGGNTE
ncbi:MAG: c-type cytochrome [Polyangiaceae bacterium]|nr:c-type cytochrome [Polyangiaceae bacterium]